jgi:thiol:disulfide interchange protein
MNAESLPNQPNDASTDAEITAQMDDLQRQRNASPYNTTVLGLMVAGVLGLPMLYFGTVKLATSLMKPSSAPAAAAVVAPDSSNSPQSSSPQTVNWNYDFKAATQLATTSNKSMMIDFYTDWCGPCKWLDANVYNLPEIATEAQNIVPVKINAEAQVDLARQYNITKYPTIIWTDSVGNEKFRQVGGCSPREFFNIMRQYK